MFAPFEENFSLRKWTLSKGVCRQWKQTRSNVKILKIGTPEIITIIVLQLEQLDFTVQYCVQKMQTEQQTEKTLIRLLHEEQSDLGLHCLLRPICPNILKLLR